MIVNPVVMNNSASNQGRAAAAEEVEMDWVLTL